MINQSISFPDDLLQELKEQVASTLGGGNLSGLVVYYVTLGKLAERRAETPPVAPESPNVSNTTPSTF